MRNLFIGALAGLALNLPGKVLGQSGQFLVHPGDLIELRVQNEPEISGEYVVSQQGTAAFPRLGEIKVSEHTPGSLEALLAQQYRPYLQDPSIEVMIRRPVRIGGAVLNAGLFRVDPTVTLSGALAMAGGPTPESRGDKVWVFRDGQIITTILGGTALLADSPIRSGDQLFFASESTIPERSWLSRNAGLVGMFMAATGIIVVFGGI